MSCPEVARFQIQPVILGRQLSHVVPVVLRHFGAQWGLAFHCPEECADCADLGVRVPRDTSHDSLAPGAGSPPPYGLTMYGVDYDPRVAKGDPGATLVMSLQAFPSVWNVYVHGR